MKLASLALLSCAWIALAAACGDDGVSRAVGARCEAARDCDERCLEPSNDSPGGFCTLSCESSEACPSGAACTDREGGVCLFTCAVLDDCAFLGPEWTCREQDLRADQGIKVKVCLGV